MVDAGSVQIVRVGKSNISTPYPSITEDYPGTPGVVQANSRFGSSIAGLPASDSVMVNTPPPTYGEAAFAISSPFQAGGSVFVLSNDRGPQPFLEAGDRRHQRDRRPVRAVRRLTNQDPLRPHN